MIEVRSTKIEDQRAVRTIVHRAQLYPFGLSWKNFLVAEQAGQIIGVGQVRPHRDGSRELASIAVMPSFQGRGIGDRLVRALLARESGTLYLMCAEKRISFYKRFGFYEISARETPPSLRWKVRTGTVVASVASRLGLEVGRVAAMKREAAEQ